MTDRDAGYREGIEAAKDAVAQLRQSAACNFTDDNCKGQRGQDRVDALYDAYQALCALPQPSTPDDAKAEPVAWIETFYEEGGGKETKVWLVNPGKPDASTIKIEPLYTRPSPASDCAIREAPKLAVSALDHVGLTYPDSPFIERVLTEINALSAHAGDAANESGGADALTQFVLDHYANQDINHVDFRVEAYRRAMLSAHQEDEKSEGK